MPRCPSRAAPGARLRSRTSRCARGLQNLYAFLNPDQHVQYFRWCWPGLTPFSLSLYGRVVELAGPSEGSRGVEGGGQAKRGRIGRISHPTPPKEKGGKVPLIS